MVLGQEWKTVKWMSVFTVNTMEEKAPDTETVLVCYRNADHTA